MSGALSTPLGNLTPGLPTAFSAGGEQSGTTRSAIAGGALIVGGEDRSEDGSINRDTDTANDGALVKEFTDEERAEIADGFAAAQILGAETAVFFKNRAEEEAKAKAEKERREKEVECGCRVGADGLPILVDADGKIDPNITAYTVGLTADELAILNDKDSTTIGSIAEITAREKEINDRYGAGSTFRIVATALNGAVGSDVSGSLTSLVQGATVKVLQSLATNKVKEIADSLQRGGQETEESATVRAALQGLTGCAGAAASGLGDCSAGAAGAAGSVVINTLLNSLNTPKNEDLNADGDYDDPGERLTLEEQEARTNLVATLVGAIASAAGIDTAEAVSAAQIETENNENLHRKNPSAFDKFLHRLRGLPKENSFVVARSLLYENFDTSLNSPGSVYKTNFFGAASDATGVFGFTGAQFTSSLPVSDWPYDDASLAALRDIGSGFWKDVNLPLYYALYDGNDDHKFLNGNKLSHVTGGTVQDLDYALIRNEQTYVQGKLNSLSARTRNNLIAQSNAILNGGLASSAIKDLIKDLGRPLNFGNYRDRVLIGQALVRNRSLRRGQ